MSESPHEGINMVSAAWLREQPTRKNATWIPILASLGPMLADALEIADEAAEAFIHSETMCADADGESWRDLSTIEERVREPIEQNVCYLEARGLLLRHSKRPQLVRFKEPAE